MLEETICFSSQCRRALAVHCVDIVLRMQSTTFLTEVNATMRAQVHGRPPDAATRRTTVFALQHTLFAKHGGVGDRVILTSTGAAVNVFALGVG